MKRKKKLLILVCGIAAVAATFVAKIAIAADPGVPAGAIDFKSPAAGHVQAHDAQVVGGNPWQVNTFTNAEGYSCLALIGPSDDAGTGTGTLCTNPATMWARGPLHYVIGAQTSSSDRAHWSDLVLVGWAAPTVSKVELLSADCQASPVQMDGSGVFLAVRSGLQAAPATTLPAEVIGYDHAGAVIARRMLPITASPAAQAVRVSRLAPANCH